MFTARHLLSALLLLLSAGQLYAADGATDYLDGLDALGAGRIADADASLTKAIQADAENASYYQARGVARTLREQFPAAIADFQKAARLASPPDWETTAWTAMANKMNNNFNGSWGPGQAPRADQPYAIGLSDMAQRYWQSRYQGSYLDAEQKKTVETNQPYTADFPKIAAQYAQRHGASSGADTKTILARVQGKIDAKQYLSALQTVDGALAAAPSNPDLLVARGNALSALNDVEGARQTFTEALTRSPSAAAYVGRARAEARILDATHLARDLSQASKLDPAAAARAPQPASVLAPTAAPELWTKLEAQCQSGAPAAQIAETARHIAWLMAGTRIRYDERYQEQRTKLEADLQAKPTDPDRQVAVARYLREQAEVMEERVGPRAEPRPYRTQSDADLKHDLERADQLVETALRDHPNNLAALTVKAHFQIQAADYDGAQKTVTKALALHENSADLLECLASLIQIQAARKITEAGNLKTPKTWYETNFLESPPVTYRWTIFPSKAELQQAAMLEQQANALSKLAEARLAQAAENAGQTAEGYYYRATLLRVRGESAQAKDAMLKAVQLKPEYQQAWYQLAALYTDLRDAEGAIAARARAYNLAQTTAVAELNALWFQIPHVRLKSARDTVAAGVKLDAADPRLPAYLAIIDEASEKPDAALLHYQMAKALGDAQLAMHGTTFTPPSDKPDTLPLSAADAAFPAAVRLRLAALLLDAHKIPEAAAEFESVRAALAVLAAEPKQPAADALLPNPDLPPGAVPPAEPLSFLQVRAAAGVNYTQWAMRHPADADLAAKTYRRLMIAYFLNAEKADTIKAVADLGLAELFVQSRELSQATEALKTTPAVPQDLWQEMRRTEAAARGQ